MNATMFSCCLLILRKAENKYKEKSERKFEQRGNNVNLVLELLRLLIVVLVAVEDLDRVQLKTY